MKTNNALGLALLVIVAVASVLQWGIDNSPKTGNAYRPVDPPHSSAASSPLPQAILPHLLPRKRSAATIVSPAKFETRHQIQSAPGDVAREATADANAGSPEAMRQLGQALRECAHADMGSDEEIEGKVAKRAIGQELLRGDSASPNVTADAQEVARLEGIRDSCKQITKDEMDQSLSWLERSAAVGDAEARFSYAWTLLQDFPTAEAKEDNAEEYMRRRDLGFAFLQDSIANGDCTNGILNGFRTVTSDPISTYVYQSLLLRHALEYYASGQLPPDVATMESASVTAALNNLAYNVPVDQRAAAENTARNILQNYCTTF